MTQPLHSPLGGIALNAIRWRSGEPDIGYAILRDDVRWLLRYIAEAEAAAPDPVASPAPLDALENFAGSGYCPGCKVAIDLHPWLEDDPDAIRCPKPREALDALYARLGQPVAEEPA